MQRRDPILRGEEARAGRERSGVRTQGGGAGLGANLTHGPVLPGNEKHTDQSALWLENKRE